MASEKDRAAVRRSGFGRPARLRSCFIGGDLSAFSATDPAGTDRSIRSFPATLQVFGDNSRCNMVYCRVRRQNASKRKLKPLPPEPFRHQDSAIARSEPCQALTISARRHSPTCLRITAFRPKAEVRSTAAVHHKRTFVCQQGAHGTRWSLGTSSSTMRSWCCA